MKVSYIVAIAVPVEEFREALADVAGARLSRELRPGQVVVVCDGPEVELAGVRGVTWVRRERPEHLDR
ncbi:hypothetical protein [Nonomuraea sp. NPDC003804]|uniref:hypothetical protein n=1 Tax=Nonomuraea sp. NPDC003804 TaxID=3154547 RepID=UPI0033A2F919